jgi:hypothetical protein
MCPVFFLTLTTFPPTKHTNGHVHPTRLVAARRRGPGDLHGAWYALASKWSGGFFFSTVVDEVLRQT